MHTLVPMGLPSYLLIKWRYILTRKVRSAIQIIVIVACICKPLDILLQLQYLDEVSLV